MAKLFFIAVLFFAIDHVSGRHTDSERDFSHCSEGFVPIGIKNADGFLKLECVKTDCQEINKQKAVCAPSYTPGCPKGAWVGSIKRQMQGNDEKPTYLTKCCVHTIFSRTVSVKPQSDFAPGDNAHDGAEGQADLVQIVTNVGVNKEFDHHSVEITTVHCGKSSTTSTSTRRPTTQRPKATTQRNQNKNNNNNNNNGNPTGGGGSKDKNNKDNNNNNHDNNNNNGNPTGGDANHGGENGGQKGGNSGGEHGGQNGGNSGGRESQPKLQGGSQPEYSKQNLPPPAKPPASANDPKSWGVGGGGAGCFSADTMVQTRNGPKRMDELGVGDEVLSSVSWDGQGAVSYQPITQFIHKDPSVFTRYTVIHTASGKSLSLTPYHLLPQFDCELLELISSSSSSAATEAVLSARQYEILFTQSARFAHRARSGQCLLVVHPDGHRLVSERITNVTSAIRRGVFSPITASGIIVANDVQASCYSSVENHALQHAFFAFVNKISRAVKPYLDMAADLFSGSFETGNVEKDSGQIPSLLRVMWMLSDMVMGSY